MEHSDQTAHPHNNRRVSTILKEFIDNASGERITLKALRDALADRAFAILMLVFALPNLIPAPIPGISAFLGLPLLFLSVQLAAGRKAPWFPLWLSEKSLSYKDLGTVLSYALPYLIRLEKILRPRFDWLVRPAAERFIAGVCVLMAVLITLPIPLGNWFPAFTITLFSLAILERDGLFALLGMVTSCISLVLVSSVIMAFVTGFLYFIGKFLF